MITRELILRKGIITRKAWCHFFAACFCLAFSALYELIEWWVTVGTGAAAEAFLGT